VRLGQEVQALLRQADSALTAGTNQTERLSAPLSRRHPYKDGVAVLVPHSDAIARLGDAIAYLSDLIEHGGHASGKHLSHGQQPPSIDHFKAVPRLGFIACLM
jgi:hypothetical protein